MLQCRHKLVAVQGNYPVVMRACSAAQNFMPLVQCAGQHIGLQEQRLRNVELLRPAEKRYMQGSLKIGDNRLVYRWSGTWQASGP